MDHFLDNCKSLQKQGFQPPFATLRLNFSRTDKSTAKPMGVGCVHYYSTHFIKKLEKSLEPFFHKVQKTTKRAKKGQKGGFQLFQEKSGSVTFEPLLPSFGKILRAVSEKSRSGRTDTRTHTDKSDSIGLRFSTGDQK